MQSAMTEEISNNDTTARKLGFYYRQLLAEGLPDEVARQLIVALGNHQAVEVGVNLMPIPT